MRRHEGKEPVVILDRYTLKEIGRYQSISLAAEDLGLNRNTINHAISRRMPAYECYWVYESMLDTFMPRPSCFIRVHGNKTSPKLQKLLSQV